MKTTIFLKMVKVKRFRILLGFQRYRFQRFCNVVGVKRRSASGLQPLPFLHPPPPPQIPFPYPQHVPTSATLRLRQGHRSHCREGGGEGGNPDFVFQILQTSNMAFHEDAYLGADPNQFSG
jgi:hypothetical protein